MKAFGEFELDENAMELRRNGRPVSINGQCLTLLVLLVDRAGQLVTRDEIRGTLWPDSNVDFDHSLDVLVSRLRAALGESGKSVRYIQTVPGKGYRFAAEVRSVSQTHPLARMAGVSRAVGRYVAVGIMAALLALLLVRSRYEKFVPQNRAPSHSSGKR